jgi:hypothetical protein
MTNLFLSLKYNHGIIQNLFIDIIVKKLIASALRIFVVLGKNKLVLRIH